MPQITRVATTARARSRSRVRRRPLLSRRWWVGVAPSWAAAWQQPDDALTPRASDDGRGAARATPGGCSCGRPRGYVPSPTHQVGASPTCASLPCRKVPSAPSAPSASPRRPRRPRPPYMCEFAMSKGASPTCASSSCRKLPPPTCASSPCRKLPPPTCASSPCRRRGCRSRPAPRAGPSLRSRSS